MNEIRTGSLQDLQEYVEGEFMKRVNRYIKQNKETVCDVQI